MAITIEKKDDPSYLNRGPCTYLRLFGADRENIRRIAAWAGKSTQQVGEELMQQAIAEVLTQLPRDLQVETNKRGEVRRKRARY
jgi:hypothetical protein